MNTKQTSCQSKHIPTPLLVVALLALVGAITASIILAATKLGIYSHAPGCGVNSGCDAIANGPWGSVPGLGWPVSFIGVAWFVSLLCSWWCKGADNKLFLYVVRAGALASVGFFVLMAVVGHFCIWCAVVHVCNIVFWGVAELVYKKSTPSCTDSCSSRCPLVPFLLVFICVSVLLGAIQLSVSAANNKKGEAAFNESVEDILQGNAAGSTLELLDARHTIGPENAPVQIVIFTDYQCPDCKRYEGELVRVIHSRDDVSLSIKHFPMNADCNTFMKGRTLHGNACWAARAAEAASILGGEEGWEKMHTWLFEQGGSFTDQTFNGDLVSLGFNPKEFIPVMMGNETLERVKEDVSDAIDLGLSYTPMIFINGVEYLWYFRGQQESIDSLVSKAVDAVKNGNQIQSPPSATEKMFEDWRRGKEYVPPGTDTLQWMGSGDIEVVVWGDYQEPYARELNKEATTLAENNANVKYSFRHFPIDESCNAGVSGYVKKYDGSCALSRVVESVSLLGDNDNRWEMHNWIVSQEAPVSLPLALEYASSLVGEDVQTIQEVMNSAEVGAKMRVDILSKNQVRRRGAPILTIQNKYVPKWKNDGITANEFLQGLVDRAGSEGTSK